MLYMILDGFESSLANQVACSLINASPDTALRDIKLV